MTVKTGERVVERFVVDETLVRGFAVLSGDDNPIHVDAEAARTFGYPRRVAHGAILVAAISRMIGTKVPGAGAVWMSQSVQWLTPVFVGDEVELAVEVTAMSDGASLLSLAMTASVGERKVMTGSGQVKVSRPLSGRAVTADGQRVALVTGGSRGIGRAAAERLAADGFRVAITYRTNEAAASSALSEMGGGLSLSADFTEPGEAERIVRDVEHALGRIDVVVHGATPALHRAGVEATTYADVRPFLDVYLGAAMGLVSATCPSMATRGFGRFIFIGTSYLFGVPPTGLSAYVAAKEALWGYTKSVSAELGMKGITSNLVSPAMTITDLVGDVPTRVKEMEARRSSMRRLATVDDIAALVSFLASDASGYVNGQNLGLTGSAL